VELENVEAIVIDNENAPLLLGQSVLKRFGSIEIDNNKNEIILR
jgi:aspartyl protease family protein